MSFVASIDTCALTCTCTCSYEKYGIYTQKVLATVTTGDRRSRRFAERTFLDFFRRNGGLFEKNCQVVIVMAQCIHETLKGFWSAQTQHFKKFNGLISLGNLMLNKLAEKKKS